MRTLPIRSFSVVAISLLAALSPLQAERVAVVSAHPDKAMLQYLAPAGEIRQGEVVAVLDCSQLITRLKEVSRRVGEAEASLKVSQEKQAVTEAINKARQEGSAEALTEAERALEKYLENDARGTEVALKLALHDAETEYKKQEERFASRDRLLAEGFIHKVEYDNEETRLKRTQLALEAAKLKMAAFQKYEREAKEAQLKQALRKVKEDHSTTDKETTEALESAAKAVELAEAAVTTLKTTQGKLTEKLASTVIRASRAGRFAPAQVTDDDAAMERGALIGNGQTLGTIAE